MDIDNVYVPIWLGKILETGSISRTTIFSLADKEYGKLSIGDRELLNGYIDDLIEERFIYQKGNFIYKMEIKELAA